MKTNLMWFRSDLRIRNNLALYSACQDCEATILALFISCPHQWKLNSMSSRKAFLIYKNIIFLKKELMKLNIYLYYHESTTFLESVNYLIKFCRKNKVNNLYYNYEYEFLEQKRDIMVMKKLKKYHIISNGFHSSTLIPPGVIINKKGEMYKKYSHFKNRCILEVLKNSLNDIFIPKKRKTIILTSNTPIVPFDFNFHRFNEQLFPIGEIKVLKKLKLFFKNKFNKYFTKNNSISNDTSMLSAHLSIGVLSPMQCLFLLFKYYPNTYAYYVKKCCWVNELIWREFFKHLLYFHPLLSQQKVLCDWENNIKWSNNEKHFEAWKRGKTGFPIVDAGMRQLNQLGWMHNRLRMVTSSFLVKNLLIDWRKGEQYFMSRLIDGDTALNNGNWQWISSIGSDSAPYFRIFNPILQSKKFDAQGKFIRKYIPELTKISYTNIHDPNTWNRKIRRRNSYPEPIINLADSKKTMLTVFKLAKYKL
ncbi:deoxyribodipyrimidine photo-lyase [Buchnera aphidicola]|uniref:Deoxyribodipyrimidine photo-lyase n=1 Tax=Buchnera aphidicola subsp. Melaphis rhois TaxID=118103 RepID=A0A4D6YG47_BUCMH|nr:deoxyribodipyrimidine photo-lyase [Buchnera aphidicola]QCI23305.1 deoxyribodipyrimidine photo-lyase [Buchnera aphidicola (Melaphis rhois)]